MGVITISNPNNQDPCVFCKTPDIDEVNLGPLYSVENVTCHYYCMLFASGLNQNGKDDEGILGFLPADILKESRRSTRLKCSFCHRSGAAVGCSKKICKYAFHFPCGLKNGIQYQFLKNYEAYCGNHGKPQDIHIDSYPWNCPICLSNVNSETELIMASCCKGAVFHRECVKKTALNAGYFFKCPMCNNKTEFIYDMRIHGIFVPEQDASWERDPGAFQELLFEYSKCDAPGCQCPKGREYSASKGNFMLARCRVCGASGVHRQCGNLKTIANWACEGCLEIELKTGRPPNLSEWKPNSSPSTSTSSFSPVRGNKPGQHFRGLRKELIVEEKNGSQNGFSLTDIKIKAPCFAYFPYVREQLEIFQSSKPPVIPDWRGYTLRVNVVDWLGEYFRRKGAVSDNPPFRTLPNDDLKLPPVKLDQMGLSPERSIRKKKKKRRSGRRSSAWRRGVIRRRAGKNGKIEISETSTDETKSLTMHMPKFDDVEDDKMTENGEPVTIQLSSQHVEEYENAIQENKSKITFDEQIIAFGMKKDLLPVKTEDIGPKNQNGSEDPSDAIPVSSQTNGSLEDKSLNGELGTESETAMECD